MLSNNLPGLPQLPWAWLVGELLASSWEFPTPVIYSLHDLRYDMGLLAQSTKRDKLNQVGSCDN